MRERCQAFAVHYCAMTRKYELKRRAETTGGDPASNRRGHGRTPHERRPGPDDDLGDRRAGRRRAPHRLRALPRRARRSSSACSAHWRELHPFPDSRSWERIADPARRLRAALQDVYAWYELVEDDLAIFSRDAGVHALTAELVGRRERGDRVAAQTARGRLAATQGRARRDRPRARLRDLALAGAAAGPDAQAGGRCDVELRRRASSLRAMATAEDRRLTDSGIEVKPVYTADDLPPGELELPGEFPFTRGPYETMYRGRPWTIRQYAGYGSAEETNARFRYLLERGQTGPLGRVRPADAARLRLGRPARRGRGRAHRGRDRLARRHGGAPRRDPARRGLDVDDDQRAGGAPPPAVRARRRGAGRAAASSCAAPSRTTCSRSTSRAGTTSSRRGRRCGWRPTSSRTAPSGCRA